MQKCSCYFYFEVMHPMIRNLNQVSFQGFGNVPPERNQSAKLFEKNEDLDIAFFQASTYNGVLLKPYPNEEVFIKGMPDNYSISMIEMVCKREKIQGKLRFDERFGLGTKFLTCGEEDIWIEDAKRAGLIMKYYPIKIAATSTLLKKSLVV